MTRVAVRDDEPFAGEERDARERLRRVLARLDTVEDESTTSDDAARAVRDVEDDLTRELAAAMLAAALAGWRRVRRLLAGAGVDVDRLPADELPARVRERVTARADRLAAAAADGVRDRLGRALDVPAGPDRAAELRRQLDIIDSTLADRTALAATQDAAGVAQQDAADTAEVGEFRWETMRDERVRDSHAAQDGAVRPRGERFPNGLRWPGDTDGPVEEWINCRCQLMPVVPEHDRPAREAAMASSEQAVDVVARAVEAALRIRPWPDATGEVGMVALAPSDEDAQRLAVDGGTPADRLHMTLAVVDVGDHDPAMIRALLAFYAEQHVDQLMAMPARVSGVARFAAADPDSQPVVALVQDDPQRGWDHLASVREWIASDLETRGHPVRRNHEPWTPHITLGVTALDDDEQLPAVDAGPITFDRLVVAVGDDWRVFPLASPDGEAVLRQFPGEFPFASHTECVERMTGEVDDPDAFCNAWKTESGMRSRSVAWKSRDRRIVEGPVLVPGEPDAKGDTLTVDEVAAIAHTFLEHGGLHDVEHDFAARSGVKPIESYVLDEPRGDLPAGTWMLAARVTDPQLVADIDAGRLRGWSVTATHAHAAARLAGRIAASTRSLPGGVREVGLADLDDPQAITVTLTGSPAVPKALWTSIKHRARSVAERVFPPARTVPDAQHGDAESHADPGDDMQTEEITAAVKAALGDALEPIEQRLAAVEAAQHSNPTDPSDPPESTPTDPGSGEGEGAAKSTGEPSSEGEATAAAVKAAIEGALEDKLAPLADRIERVEKSLPVASRKALGQDPAPHRDDAAGKTDGETYRRPYRDAQGRRIDHKQEA